jgi:hypothetical protein
MGHDVRGQVQRDQLGYRHDAHTGLDFGGPNANPPPSRSFSCRATRTVRA